MADARVVSSSGPISTGAMGGASIGAAFGLPGALVGAGLGALLPLLGHFFGGNQMTPEELQRNIARLYQSSPHLAQGFYQAALSSPAYTQGQNTIAAGANATSGALAQKLGAAGLGSTGTGAVLSSLGPSIVGSQQAGLRTQAYNQAQQQAMQQIQEQIRALVQSQGQPSQGSQLAGAVLGSLGQAAPYLLSRGG